LARQSFSRKPRQIRPEWRASLAPVLRKYFLRPTASALLHENNYGKAAAALQQCVAKVNPPAMMHWIAANRLAGIDSEALAAADMVMYMIIYMMRRLQ
jgi:hypothetical protein